MGLEVEPLNQQNQSDMGTPDSGLVCYQEHNPAGACILRQWGWMPFTNNGENWP